MKLIMENWKKFLSERVELEDLPIGPQPLRLHKEANAQIILAKDNPGLFDRSNDQFWSEDPGKIEYYKERGWDINTGVPTREKLVELGLEYAADQIDADNT